MLFQTSNWCSYIRTGDSRDVGAPLELWDSENREESERAIWFKEFCKVHIFWEGHRILGNLPLTFDCMYCSQKKGEDFAKFCGLLRIYEL